MGEEILVQLNRVGIVLVIMGMIVMGLLSDPEYERKIMKKIGRNKVRGIAGIVFCVLFLFLVLMCGVVGWYIV